MGDELFCNSNGSLLHQWILFTDPNEAVYKIIVVDILNVKHQEGCKFNLELNVKVIWWDEA